MVKQTPVSKITVRARKKEVMSLAGTSHVAINPNGESMYYDSQSQRITEVQAQIIASVRNKKLTPLMQEIMHLYRVAKLPDDYKDFPGKPLRPLQGAALHSWVAGRVGLPKIEVELLMNKAEAILAKMGA